MHSMKPLLPILVCALLPWQTIWSQEQNPVRQMQESYQTWQEETDRNFQDYLARQDAEWQAYVADIEARWNEFEASTPKKWIDYGGDLNVKSRVDFEAGHVEIETIQDADDPAADAKARESVQNQLQKLVDTDNEAQTNVLEDQITVDETEKSTLDQTNVQEYFEENVRQKIQPIDRIQSGDGKTRIRYRVRVPFVINHIVRRAQKYLPTVVKYASQYDLDPRLVLAVIYVESSFNPLARSHADAYGMMQLIPRYGAREAYKFVYKQDRIVSPQYLYSPENNIQLGCSYLYILLNHYWDTEPHQEKRRDLSICSYNWGPHNVKRKVYDRFEGSRLTYPQLYALLRKHTPDETSNYLEMVLNRRSYFDPYFEGL